MLYSLWGIRVGHDWTTTNLYSTLYWKFKLIFFKKREKEDKDWKRRGKIVTCYHFQIRILYIETPMESNKKCLLEAKIKFSMVTEGNVNQNQILILANQKQQRKVIQQ